MAYPTIHRIRCTWTGFAGAPGVSTFYYDGGALPDLTKLRNFWQALAGQLPTGLTIHIGSDGDTIDAATGNLTGTWSNVGVSDVTGSGGSGYVGSSGGMITWTTDEIHNNRHLRGRTFVIPMIAANVAGSGVLPAPVQDVLKNAAAGLVTDWKVGMAIWGRPRPATSPRGAAPGIAGALTGSSVSNLQAVLRSRRD